MSSTNTQQSQEQYQAEFERAADAFVQREVICCVSMLISGMIDWNRENFFEFFEVFLRYDENDDPIEIYEYWFVSGYLAEKLEAKGEIIAHDFFGHSVWGRTTTGQSICMDHVIQEIVLDLRR